MMVCVHSRGVALQLEPFHHVRLLDCTGDAGSLAADVGLYARVLAMLYTNNTAPHLRGLTGPGDLPWAKEVCGLV
jgi:hypothetical protein